MEVAGIGVLIPYCVGAVGVSGDGGEVPEGAATRRRRAVEGDAAAAENAMVTLDVGRMARCATMCEVLRV